jgi:predicted O-methyltransferase YrrM
MKQLIKFILPHGIVRLLQTRQEQGYQRSRAVLKQQVLAKKAFSHADLLDYLEARGLDRDQVRQGSIPEPSLAFLASILKEKHDGQEIIRGLHVGNFLGVSLAYLTDAATHIHSSSVIVAVDPNLEHRGITHPQDHVCALLNHLGLSENVLLCCGFSHAKNVGNDGRNYLENYRFLETEEIATKIAQEHAPHGVFGNLQKLVSTPFDFALIDGNHESVYVEEELRKIHPLMKRGGYIFMDDISEGWPMLKQVFETSSNTLFRIAEADGRVGVLEVL